MMRTPLFNASLRPKLTLQAMGLGLLLTVFGNAVTADDFAALKDLQDSRVVLDRLHPENNAHGEDFKELNAIGVLAAVDQASSTVYGFGSGALIDGCHVLTAQHVIYGGQGDFDTPPPAPSLEFLVGQVTPEEHNLTEGLRYVRFATATAMGGTGQHDGRSDSAERDWAVVTLTENLPEILRYGTEPIGSSNMPTGRGSRVFLEITWRRIRWSRTRTCGARSARCSAFTMIPTVDLLTLR
jgi:hypothetical protein